MDQRSSFSLDLEGGDPRIPGGGFFQTTRDLPQLGDASITKAGTIYGSSLFIKEDNSLMFMYDGIPSKVADQVISTAAGGEHYLFLGRMACSGEPRTSLLWKR